MQRCPSCYLSRIVLVLASAVSTTACDNDDNGSQPQACYVGTWLYQANEDLSGRQYVSRFRLELRGDGTFRNEQTETPADPNCANPTFVSEGTYTVAASTMTFTVQREADCGAALQNAGITNNTTYTCNSNSLTLTDPNFQVQLTRQ